MFESLICIGSFSVDWFSLSLSVNRPPITSVLRFTTICYMQITCIAHIPSSLLHPCHGSGQTPAHEPSQLCTFQQTWELPEEDQCVVHAHCRTSTHYCNSCGRELSLCPIYAKPVMQEIYSYSYTQPLLKIWTECSEPVKSNVNMKYTATANMANCLAPQPPPAAKQSWVGAVILPRPPSAWPLHPSFQMHMCSLVECSPIKPSSISHSTSSVIYAQYTVVGWFIKAPWAPVCTEYSEWWCDTLLCPMSCQSSYCLSRKRYCTHLGSFVLAAIVHNDHFVRERGLLFLQSERSHT